MKAKAQLWLDTYYPKDIKIHSKADPSSYLRNHVRELNIPWGGGHLDLTDFVGLETLNLKGTKLDSVDLSKNTRLNVLFIDDSELTTLDLSNNKLLWTITIKAPKMNNDLRIFSHLSKSLGLLDITGSDFNGSIEDLKDFEKLHYLDITSNKNIKGELQHLPLNLLSPQNIVNYPHEKKFYYKDTDFEKQLEDYNDDINIWRTAYNQKHFSNPIAVDELVVMGKATKDGLESSEKSFINKETQTELTSQQIINLENFKAQIEAIAKN